MSIRDGDTDKEYVSEREPTQVAINRCPCRFQFLVCAPFVERVLMELFAVGTVFLFGLFNAFSIFS